MKRIVILTAVIALAASLASARIVTRTPGGAAMGMNMETLLVANDGTVITVRHTPPVTSQDSPTVEVVAISSSKSILWTWEAQYGARVLTLDQNRVIVATHTAGDGQPNHLSRLAALSLQTGEVAWEVELEGVIHDVEPGIGMLYVLLVSPSGYQNSGRGSGGHGPGMPGTPPGSGGGPYGPADGSRTLVGIGENGTVVWTLELTE